MFESHSLCAPHNSRLESNDGRFYREAGPTNNVHLAGRFYRETTRWECEDVLDWACGALPPTMPSV